MTGRSCGNSLSLTWDKNGNLLPLSDGTQGISNKYDPIYPLGRMGNRVWKNSSATGQRKYVVDIASGLPTILMEINPSNGSLIKTYIYANGQILAQHDGGPSAAIYFYLHDRLGAVRQVIGTD